MTIMKKYISSILALSLVMLCGCDDYNDRFDGYDDHSAYTDVKSVEYTLTNADYSTIATNKTNIAMALAADSALWLEAFASDTTAKLDSVTYRALLAVKNNHYFGEELKIGKYLQAFVEANKSWLTLDDGSALTINYNSLAEMPKQIAKIEGGSSYTVSAADYATVWTNSEGYTFFTPAYSPASNLPGILKTALPNAVAGDYAVVTYNYSDNEPGGTTGGGGGEVETYNKIGTLIAAGKAGAAKVQGEVVATYARGMLVSDGTGTILAYLGGAPVYSLGDKVTIDGTTALYGGLLQFTADATYTKVSKGESFAYPTPTAMSTADLKSYLSAPSVKYVTYKGVLSISGSYYNVTFDDDATIQGSLSYPAGGVVDPNLDGEEVTVTGYLIGVSSSKYLNTMVTSVTMAGVTAPTPIGVVALSAAGSYSVTGVVAATYSRGFLLTDGTGYILVYTNALTEYKEGDVIKVTGTTTEYAGLKQFPATSTIEKSGTATLSRPKSPVTLDGTAMDAYVTAPQALYVTYTGTLTISGIYYNVAVDGAKAAIGSLSYPLDGTISADLNGKKVTVTGYAVGTSSSKYVNTMVLSVTAATASATKAHRAAAKVATTTQYAVYTFDGTAWAAAKKTAILQKSDYTLMGQSYANLTSTKAADGYLPTYLGVNYPYAADGDDMTVVYFLYSGGKTSTKATVYTYNALVWSKTTNVEVKQANFSRGEGKWAFDNRAAYINETLLGDQGDFIIVDVDKSTLSYVWSNTASYGMKASGYYSGSSNVVESWVISPAVTLDRDSVKLSFEQALNYLSGNNRADFVSVLITTDKYDGSSNPNTITWSELDVPQWPDGASWTFVSSNKTNEDGSIAKTIDLTQYNGQTIRIGFRYKGTSLCCPTWEFKNVLMQ